MKPLIFAVDFDGTCVTHEYPKIGKEIGAAPVLKALTDKGHKIILNTMRSGDLLDEAVNWFIDHNIPLYGINKNPDQKKWTDSPKVYANFYIDDANFGIPLVSLDGYSDRAFINWVHILLELQTVGVFDCEEGKALGKEILKILDLV